MSQRRSYQGIGVLLVLGERIENTKYEFIAEIIGGRIEAHGTLQMNSISDMMKAFNAGNIVLQMQNGETVDVAATGSNVNSSTPALRFAISGVIPGYP